MADLQLEANRSLRTVADLPCPRGVPILGNLFQMAPAKLHLTLEQWAKQFGSPYRVQLGTIPVTVWTQADLFQTVMRERPPDGGGRSRCGIDHYACCCADQPSL